MQHDSALHLHTLLTHHGCNAYYEALDSDDISDSVMILLDYHKQSKRENQPLKSIKTEATSTAFRNKGNAAYKAGKYQKALELYNKALLHAPIQSLVMTLAYSNRSALLFTVREFRSCLRDIDTCFTMRCPEHIVQKLKKRKEEARANRGEYLKGIMYANISNEYFLLNTRNPHIPCASAAVGIITEDQVPIVVATTDINVGTVVSVETAFVNQTLSKYSSCHHCNKMSLNLIPCNNCCFALFCDEDCMKSSINECHGIECQIMDVVIGLDLKYLLAVKAMLKIHKMCKSWEELVKNSHSFGVERMRKSSINAIFDVDRKFSLLCLRDDKHFVHGAMYAASFICSVIIDCLDRIQTFFPQSPDKKQEARRAIARVFMFLTIYGSPTVITPAVTVITQRKAGFHRSPNFGIFSFTGKLRHACNPNLFISGLNGVVALIAVKPIKRGTVLTISYPTHYLDLPFNRTDRKVDMIRVYGIACDCCICSGEWQTRDEQLSADQKYHFRQLHLEHLAATFNPLEISNEYRKLCEALGVLQSTPYSMEYKAVYSVFRQYVALFQNATCQNHVLDYNNDD